MKKKLNAFIEQYGAVAFVTYLATFVLAFAGFAYAIKAGITPTSTAENAGLFAAAYLATKATQPIRIGITLVLTPFIASAIKRLRPG